MGSDMEAIILHLIYACCGLGTVYMLTNAYKHRNDCEMKKATSLASIDADQRLLVAHNEERPADPFVDGGPPPANGAYRPRKNPAPQASTPA